MHVTDIPFNQSLGMILPPEGSGSVLAMKESPLLLNHVGRVIAAAQCALAEAASGEFLLQQLGGNRHGVLALLRHAEAKFRKAAHGTLQAQARFAQDDAASFLAELAARGRVLLTIQVEVSDQAGEVVMRGRYDWFLQREAGTESLLRK